MRRNVRGEASLIFKLQTETFLITFLVDFSNKKFGMGIISLYFLFTIYQNPFQLSFWLLINSRKRFLSK